jgi:hypothetical protein
MSELMAAAQAIEEQGPFEANSVRYASRIQTSLPHSNKNLDPFKPFIHEHGSRKLEIKPDSRYGMPFGALPRLVLLWIADEVRKKERPLILLGDNLSKFMAELDIVPTGGRWGSITRLRNQMLRLFNADIRFTSANKDGQQGILFSIQKHTLWWDRPSNPVQSDLWQSQILLTDPLFEELLVNSSPVDMRAIRAMRRSPMELDIYCWLTYRMKHLKRTLFLSYEDLSIQFPIGYDKKNIYNIRNNLDKGLWAVLKQYPACRVEPRAHERGKEGWRLHPSPTHVPESKYKPNLFPKKPKRLL